MIPAYAPRKNDHPELTQDSQDMHTVEQASSALLTLPLINPVAPLMYLLDFFFSESVVFINLF
jgi:hypothetical protein